jgi:hypothetical protein
MSGRKQVSRPIAGDAIAAPYRNPFPKLLTLRPVSREMRIQ